MRKNPFRYRVRRKLDGHIVTFTNYLVQAVLEQRYYGLTDHEIINRKGDVVIPKRNYWLFNHHTGRTEQE